MNLLDVLIVIVAVLFGLHGFYRGLVHQIFFVASIFAGIYGGMYASTYVGKVFGVFTESPDIQRLLGFALSFVLISILVGLLGRLIHRGFRWLALGWVDHLLGALFGVGAAALLTAFGVYVMNALLPSDSKFVRGSTFAPHAQEIAHRMLALIPESLHRRFEEKLAELRRRRFERQKGGRAAVPPAPPPGYKAIQAPPATPPLPGPAPVLDLVDIRTVSSGIRLDMRYATRDNFLRQPLYPVARCLLKRNVAKRLARVQKRLRKASLGLKVWDCYRPLSVQWRMWKAVPQPDYVADPRVGSNHNRGAAVDVTLVDAKGRDLWMPTDFDDFTPKARQDAKAPGPAARNRQILRDAMVAEGFIAIATEWWHYDAPDASKYAVLDAPFERIP